MKDELVALVGNGPSAARGWEILDARGEPYLQARMNFFFLEPQPRFGTHVDFYFWAVDRKEMHDHLRAYLRDGRYSIGKFMSGAPAEKLNYSDGPVLDDPFFPEEDLLYHWQIIASNPRLARMMMSRPLPTCGLQALATLALLGYRRFEMIGMDFYESSTARYAYTIPDSLAEKLGSKHTTPGYEAGAHGLKEDLDFLRAILAEFPDIDLRYHGDSQRAAELIDEARETHLRWKEAQTDTIESEGISTGPSTFGGDRNIAEMIEAFRSELTSAQIEARTACRQIEALSKETMSRLANAERMAKSAKAISQAHSGILNVMANDGMPFTNVVWLVHEMSSMAGVYRPLQAYVDYCQNETDWRPRVINLSQLQDPSVRSAAEYVTAKPHVLAINSIACFHQPQADTFIRNAEKVAIYLHETEWTVSRYAQMQPEGFELFQEIIKDATVLCVSPDQAHYVERTFGPRDVRVVWNTVDAMLDSQQRKAHTITAKALGSKTDGDRLRIGMVGSFQSRKGSELFTQVARIFKQANPNSNFNWVGKRHEGEVAHEWIKFWGPKPPAVTQQLLENFDLVFIPSRDDPQPLVALEAASRGKHIVCYGKIGTAEWIRGIDGCGVFEEYSPQAAIEAMMTALSKPVDRVAFEKVLTERFDQQSFFENVNQAIQPLIDKIEKAPSQGEARTRALLIGAIRAEASDDDSVAWDDVARNLRDLQNDRGNISNYFQLARKIVIYDRELARKLAFSCLSRNPSKPSAKRELARFLFECFDDTDLALDLARHAREQNPESRSANELVDRIEASISADASA